MSLDISLTAYEPKQVFEANITHNLTEMAKYVGLYEALWRPDTLNFYTAGQLIEPLAKGLKKLLEDPLGAHAYGPLSGWGTYDTLLKLVRDYLIASILNPEAKIEVAK